MASIKKERAVLPNYLDAYLEKGLNVVLVNGPNVRCNSPMKTLEDFGESQLLGLPFLETALKAKEIILTRV